jgi:GrpB-like predicted nucleotidyltransferase (UPF0157 family)
VERLARRHAIIYPGIGQRRQKLTGTPEPIARFLGEFCVRGNDWDTHEFGSLFQRLTAIGVGASVSKRYVRYYGQAQDRSEVRFFGVEAESIGRVPVGMVGFELGEDEIKVVEPESGGSNVSWTGHLVWNWLDRRRETSPVGEFTATVPLDWTSQKGASLEFVLSANAYFDRGKALDNDVGLVSYDPLWPARFSEMAHHLRRDLPPEVILRIEHYGSTAIPNMPAKPVIDILVEVPSFLEARRSLIPAFNKPGSEYWWYNDHLLFILREAPMGKREYHVHVAPRGHHVWDGIAFRDYLRSNPDEASRYSALKYELAERFPEDREAYTESKETYVNRVTARALLSSNQ